MHLRVYSLVKTGTTTPLDNNKTLKELNIVSTITLEGSFS